MLKILRCCQPEDDGDGMRPAMSLISTEPKTKIPENMWATAQRAHAKDTAPKTHGEATPLLEDPEFGNGQFSACGHAGISEARLALVSRLRKSEP
jgi:hypothetical protein